MQKNNLIIKQNEKNMKTKLNNNEKISMEHETPPIANVMLVDVLSQDEISEGNKLMLDFIGVESNKSDEWIIECSLYDTSWDELMKVSEKISTTSGGDLDGVNRENFNFRHRMFHEIIGKKNFLYRRCVHFIKFYNEAVSKNFR